MQKINVKNAFDLQLIDYMTLMLKKKDSIMNDFSVSTYLSFFYLFIFLYIFFFNFCTFCVRFLASFPLCYSWCWNLNAIWYFQDDSTLTQKYTDLHTTQNSNKNKDFLVLRAISQSSLHVSRSIKCSNGSHQSQPTHVPIGDPKLKVHVCTVH